MNIDKAAQSVVPMMAQAIFKENDFKDPCGCYVLACTLFSLLEGVILGGDLELFIMELGDDFDNGEILIKGDAEDFGEKLDPEELLIKSGLITVNGEAGKFLERVMAEKVPFRPTPISEEFKRKFEYTRTGKPSLLMIEAVDALEATPFTNNEYMLGVVNEVFNSVEDDHAFKDMAWLLEGVNAMNKNEAHRHHFKPDFVTRMHQASYRGTPMSGDLGGALYEAVGVEEVKNPQRALELLLWNMEKELSSFSSHNKFRKAVKKANKNPVKFVVDNYDTKGLKPFSFVRTSKLLVELEAHINNGDPLPYFGYLMGMDMKCAGVQVGAILTSQYNLAEACGLSLKKGKDAYEIAASKLRVLGFSSITRLGMKEGLIPILYGQTAMGLMRRKGVKSKELWDAMHSDGLSEEKAKLVANTINKVLGKIHGLRKTMKKYCYDFSTEESLINKPIRFKTADGCVVAPRHKVRVNLEGDVVAFGTENPDVQIKLPNGFSKFFEKPTLETSKENLPKYGKDGLVNLIHSTDATFARLVITKLHRRGIIHILSLHDCFKTDINHQDDLLEVIKEAMMELFGQEGNFPSTDLPEGTDLVKKWFEGASESLIGKKDVVGTTQYFAYPGVDRRGNKKGKDGGVNRFIHNLRRSGTEFSDLIEALCHPADRKEGVNSFYAN